MFKTKYLIFTLLGLLACGNPTIKRYLVRVPLSKPATDSRNLVNEVKKAEAPEKKDLKSDVLKQNMVIYDQNNLKITLSSLNADELDQLAERLGLYPSQRYYRLPGLTYFKYDIENTGKEELKINLFQTRFQTEFGQVYAPLGIEKYNKMYTSTSYNRFDYDFIYSFYVTSKNGKVPESDEFYFSKTLPEKSVTLQPGNKGFQIIPYEMFSPGNRVYVLQFKAHEKAEKKNIAFYYRAVRSDREKQLKD